MPKMLIYLQVPMPPMIDDNLLRGTIALLHVLPATTSLSHTHRSQVKRLVDRCCKADGID